MDFTHFWTNTAEIEEKGLEIGFSLYGPGHLLWLTAIVITVILVSEKYKHMNETAKARTRKLFGIGLVLMEVYRDTVLAVTGNFRPEYLPLHLCSYAIFGIFADSFRSKGTITRQFCAYAFLPGAVAALLFCNWTEYPFWNYMCIHSFVIHGSIACYVIMRYRCGEIRPSYTGLWQTLLALGVLIPPVFAFNRAFDTNFMFLNGASAGSPLVPLWNWFGEPFGYPGYLLSIVVLAVVVFHILWLAYALAEQRRKKREKR